MKVLLVKDVYKLGRAGDVKKVADGYGRNFLIPQGLAMLATPGALKQAERIGHKATEQRAILNEEMGEIAKALENLVLTFGARAGETGKLYGSITSADIVESIQKKTAISIKRQQIDMQPLRTLGEHTIHIRLTMDLVPEITAIVHREGEPIPAAEAVPAMKPAPEAESEPELEAVSTVDDPPADATDEPGEADTASPEA
ncbi:MAG: 50S ribosomal protein L9 [Chloroflexota bacterium]